MAKPPHFIHRPICGPAAAGESVSSLLFGALRAAMRSCLAGVRAVGFSFHGRSVQAHGSRIYGE